MKTNVALKYPVSYTHEGAVASRITPEQELRRLSAACLLWEDGFYESGVSVADRIAKLVPQCRPDFVAACAFEARTKQKLRHLPLLLCVEMLKHARHKPLVGVLLADVIQRADEIAEFLAIFAKGRAGRKVLNKLPNQAKKALAAAFLKFDEYQFAKYDRAGAIKLRDALFLCHAKPDTEERAELFRKIVNGTLKTPDTWEVALSGGADKRATFERLMAENNLGALAFLRNMRNMAEAGVSAQAVREYAERVRLDRVLPFRFIAAARVVPQWESLIEPMMLKSMVGMEKFSGRNIVLVDVSSSMDSAISSKSDMRRLDAACGVAVLLRELCDDVRVFTFSSRLVEVPGRRGFALRDAIVASQPHVSTYLGRAVQGLPQYDRLIVVTDEQSADCPEAPSCRGYIINVASNRNGVGYGKWMHIDGWSESVVDYIKEYERLNA